MHTDKSKSLLSTLALERDAQDRKRRHMQTKNAAHMAQCIAERHEIEDYRPGGSGARAAATSFKQHADGTP